MSTQHGSMFSEQPEKIREVLRRLFMQLSVERPQNSWDNRRRAASQWASRAPFVCGPEPCRSHPWLLDQTLLRTPTRTSWGVWIGKDLTCHRPSFDPTHRAGRRVGAHYRSQRRPFAVLGQLPRSRAGGTSLLSGSRLNRGAQHVLNPFTQRHSQERTMDARVQSLLLAMGLYYGDAYGKSFFQSITLDTLTALLAITAIFVRLRISPIRRRAWWLRGDGN